MLSYNVNTMYHGKYFLCSGRLHIDWTMSILWMIWITVNIFYALAGFTLTGQYLAGVILKYFQYIASWGTILQVSWNSFGQTLTHKLDNWKYIDTVYFDLYCIIQTYWISYRNMNCHIVSACYHFIAYVSTWIYHESDMKESYIHIQAMH